MEASYDHATIAPRATRTRIFKAGRPIFHRMKSGKPKRVASRTHTARGRRSAGRQLVPVDQGPLRRGAASECNREMARLEKMRAEWRRFEQEDRPAFERWRAATFGPLLSRQRETEARLREKEALIFEVETEMFIRGTRSHRAAYAAVMRRRTSPPRTAEADADSGEAPPLHDGPDPFETNGTEIPEFEQTLLFEDFLRTCLGIDPDRMSDRKYEEMFADFQEKFIGQGEPEPPPRASSRPAAAAPKSEQSRIKEIYRILVRRLHPDTRADADAGISALWHEVQEAYSHGNLERLEMLLALTDIRSDAAGEHTSLFQMRSVLRELRRSLNALRRSLGAGKKELAWGFARTTDRSALQSRLQRQFESDIAVQQDRLREAEALLADWSKPAKPGGKRPVRHHGEFLF